jgi:hypothetical protein
VTPVEYNVPFSPGVAELPQLSAAEPEYVEKISKGSMINNEHVLYPSGK